MIPRKRSVFQYQARQCLHDCEQKHMAECPREPSRLPLKWPPLTQAPTRHHKTHPAQYQRQALRRAAGRLKCPRGQHFLQLHHGVIAAAPLRPATVVGIDVKSASVALQASPRLSPLVAQRSSVRSIIWSTAAIASKHHQSDQSLQKRLAIQRMHQVQATLKSQRQRQHLKFQGSLKFR